MSNDFQQIKQKAEELRKKGHYAEALPLYEQLWKEQGDSHDKWVGWGYAQCLRKQGKSNEALDICRIIHKLEPSFENNNNLYGWCIYDIAIKQTEDDFNEGKFFKGANAITELTRQEDYSPYQFTIFAVIKHLEDERDKIENKQSQNASDFKRLREINEGIVFWLSRLDPSLLSVVAEKKHDGSTFPSPREKWHISKVKSLRGLEVHTECIEACTHALTEIKDLHYGFDIWLRWYRIQCYTALEEYELALPDFDYIFKQKQDPWIRAEYAHCLYALGRVDEAIQQAALVALPPKGLGFRWKIYLELGNMLSEIGKDELAAKHILLAAAIRHEEGWDKIPENLQSALQKFNLSTDDLPDTKTLHRELQKLWKSVKPVEPLYQTTHKGVIELIHDNGKSGRIMGDDGKAYFFGMKSYKSKRQVMPRLRVGFNLQENLNTRTGKTEMHAVDIHVEE